MTTALNVRHNLYRAPTAITDPGSAGTITIDKDGGVCSVVTAAAEARTLRQATKAGIVGTVVLDTDGGDLTLTVTGGYNAGADTTITFDDAGDFVRFQSIKVGTAYLWRVIGQEGAALSVATEHGAGAIGTGVAPVTSRRTKNGTIITEIKVDLAGLACKGTAAKDAIGLATGGAAYIGRNVVDTNGVVFRVEMICLEVPGEGTETITTDIDLGADDSAVIAYDGAVDDVVINTAGLAAGKMFVTDIPALTADDYLYLVEGDTAATTGVYNAGQVIVRLYGHAILT